MKRFLLCGILAVASFVGSQVRAEDCNSTQLDMSECAGSSFQAADKKLNQLYAELMKRYEPEQKALLKKAQKAWVAYRDAQCSFNTSGSEGGSAHPMALVECREVLTWQQISILEKNKNCEEGDMSCVR